MNSMTPPLEKLHFDFGLWQAEVCHQDCLKSISLSQRDTGAPEELLLRRYRPREMMQIRTRACLDQVLLEQNLDDLLQDGQQPRVVHAHAALQHRQQRSHLRAGSPRLIVYSSQKSSKAPLPFSLC